MFTVKDAHANTSFGVVCDTGFICAVEEQHNVPAAVKHLNSQYPDYKNIQPNFWQDNKKIYN